MTDDALSQPVTLNRADGTALTFRILSPAQRMQYRAVFRTYRKMWLIETLRLLGIEGRDAIPHCNELDGRRVRESHIVAWLNEPEGLNEAILLSLRSANPAATMDDVYALGLDDDERLTVGAGVMMLRVTGGPAKGGTAAEGGTPFAETPGTGGTGTTDGTPESSAASPDTPTPSPSPSTSSTPTSPTPSTSAA